MQDKLLSNFCLVSFSLVSVCYLFLPYPTYPALPFPSALSYPTLPFHVPYTAPTHHTITYPTKSQSSADLDTMMIKSYKYQ